MGHLGKVEILLKGSCGYHASWGKCCLMHIDINLIYEDDPESWGIPL